jgi:hypothetical protein
VFEQIIVYLFTSTLQILVVCSGLCLDNWLVVEPLHILLSLVYSSPQISLDIVLCAKKKLFFAPPKGPEKIVRLKLLSSIMLYALRILVKP